MAAFKTSICILLVALNSISLSLAFFTSSQNFPISQVLDGNIRSQQKLLQRNALPTPEESAAALTDYMAKAHTEKLRAVADATKESTAKIEALEAEVAELKAKLEDNSASTVPSPATVSSTDSSGLKSVELPFTNKAMGQRLDAYRTFTAKYLVKAQQDKFDAVKSEKEKWVSYFSAKTEEVGKDFQ